MNMKLRNIMAINNNYKNQFFKKIQRYYTHKKNEEPINL